MSNFHDAKITKTGQSVAPCPAHVQTFDMTMKDSSLQRYKKSGEPSRLAGLTKVKNVSYMLVQIYKKIGRTIAAIPIQDQNIEYVLLNLYPRQR